MQRKANVTCGWGGGDVREKILYKKRAGIRSMVTQYSVI
jgi:hypothetical protein